MTMYRFDGHTRGSRRDPWVSDHDKGVIEHEANTDPIGDCSPGSDAVPDAGGSGVQTQLAGDGGRDVGEVVASTTPNSYAEFLDRSMSR